MTADERQRSVGDVVATPDPSAPAGAVRLARHWPKLRAAIIGYFIFFNVLAAVPRAGGASPERFKRPLVAAEVTRWAEFLNGLGIDVDPPRLVAGYRRFASAIERARQVALTPIAWWFELTQTEQSWRLFGTPREWPSALEINVSGPNGQRTLYRSQDPRHAWQAAWIEYRRVRAAYTPAGGRPPPTYAGFAARVSERVFDEMPSVERVTLALIEQHTTLPTVAPDSARRRTHSIELGRPPR